MARRMKTAPKAEKNSGKKPTEKYEHPDKKRKNNPPAGLVKPETDRESGKKTYAYNPHLDPQLIWADKAEHTSFEVPTVPCMSMSGWTLARSLRVCGERTGLRF